MADSNGSNGQHDLPDNIDVTQLPRKDADKGREPKLLSSRLGTRSMSVAALIERIVGAFNEEHGEGKAESPAMKDADTPTKRMKLLLATTDYVLAVESVQISQNEKADILRRVYSELFGYGPLDTLFADERITTISLDGMDKASARYGHGDLIPIGPLFEDNQHLRQTLSRLLRDARAELSEEQPFVEAGLRVEGRPVCLNLMTPPITIQLRADIRVHPKTLPTLDDLVAQNFMPTEAAALLRALTQSPQGFVIVGDTESGKTTLLSVLAQLLPEPDKLASVERAGELRLPIGAQQWVVRWRFGEQKPVSFVEQVSAALENQPKTILLDEVRADQPEAVALLLTQPEAPRQIWSFRGASDANRIRSALGMVARRANPTQSEAMVHALYERLPFIVAIKRTKGTLQVRGIAEWQYPPGAEYPDYVELLTTGWEGLEFTGKRPTHPLDLPGDFWRKS
jgi:type IV secretory pathway ATPase VirB11/archaellum biosynthesis ATPase